MFWIIRVIQLFVDLLPTITSDHIEHILYVFVATVIAVKNSSKYKMIKRG
jgi:hypothetical protein